MEADYAGSKGKRSDQCPGGEGILFGLSVSGFCQFEPNHALARDSFPYILSTADAVLFFCYNSRKPA